MRVNKKLDLSSAIEANRKQCDQIELHFKGFGDKISYIFNCNIWHFGAILIKRLLKIDVGTFKTTLEEIGILLILPFGHTDLEGTYRWVRRNEA